jgi:peptidoglycan/xylan/chitin deacetylase (PgdA/CDA1 family)
MRHLKLLVITVLVILIFAAGIFSTANPSKAASTSGVVSIVFDDGVISQFNNAFPLMQQHGFSGTYYIISDKVGTANYMTISDLQALQNAGSEIASHSVDHQAFTYLTDTQINNQCNISQRFLRENGLVAVNFAYPSGYANSHTDSIVLNYYRSARHSYGDGYLMPIPPTGISMSIPMGFAGETGDSSVLVRDQEIVNQAHATNSWVIIFFHEIITTPVTSPYAIEQNNFAVFLNYVANSGVQVLTVDQALNLWSPSYRATVLPSAVNMNLGQSQTFAASAFNITGPYTYHWYLNSSVVGANTSSYTFNAQSTGSFSLYANVTDSADTPQTAKSNIALIAVNPTLVAPAVAAASGVIDQGQSSKMTSVAVTTGTRPYNYQWLQGAPGSSSYSSISGATSSNYSFVTSSSTATGAWRFKLQVTDATLDVVTSNTVSVTVNAVPAVVLSPSSWIMDVGQSKTFTAFASGGSGSYTSYQWYVGGVVQSGATASTFSYSPGASGSYSITVTVTDSLATTSAQSSAVFVVVSAVPAVSVAPVGPVTLDVGQVQVFAAVAGGGSGSLSYRWYLDGSAVGSNSSSYSYTASGSSHLVTCRVTDSASVPVTSGASNAVSVTVNPKLVAPTLTSTPSVINQGQNSILTSSAISTGTFPYSYQWLQRAPNGSFSPISGATSDSYSFVTSIETVAGNWSFILQVKDSVGAATNSSAVSVTVNVPSLDHFVFSSVGTQTAGTSFSVTITAKDVLNNTLTAYVGTNTLNVSTGTISPISTGVFSSGVWTGSVTVTGAGSGVTIQVSDGSYSGISNSFTVIIAPTPTPTPISMLSSTLTPRPTSTPATPAPTPTATTTPSPTQTPITTPKETQSSLNLIIYGIPPAFAVLSIIGTIFVLKKIRKNNIPI